MWNLITLLEATKICWLFKSRTVDMNGVPTRQRRRMHLVANALAVHRMPVMMLGRRIISPEGDSYFPPLCWYEIMKQRISRYELQKPLAHKQPWSHCFCAHGSTLHVTSSVNIPRGTARNNTTRVHCCTLLMGSFSKCFCFPMSAEKHILSDFLRGGPVDLQRAAQALLFSLIMWDLLANKKRVKQSN